MHMTKKKTPKTHKTPAKTPRHPRKADFNRGFFQDELAVLREIAEALDIDKDELDIKYGSSPNGYGDAYTIATHGGRQEWIVMRDEDEFDSAAVEGVKNDLQESPENFEPNFIQSHIDIDCLRNELHSDVSGSNTDYASEIGAGRFWEEAPDHGIDIPDDVQTALDKGEDPRKPTSAEIDAFEEDMTEQQLRYPIKYLEEIFGTEESQKKAAEIGRINIDAAAEEAVRTDGAAHFMCSYNGNYSTSPSGFIYWRHN